MQVQAIRDNNNNPNFGDLKAIICHGSFSKRKPKHAILINKVLNSDIFKKFGEKYDYVAHFERKLIPSFFDTVHYRLYLTPMKKKLFSRGIEKQIAKETKLTDLPSDFIVINSEASATNANPDSEFRAYSAFIKKLEEINLDELNSSLEKAQLKTASEQAFENIKNSDIPVY